MTSLIEITNQYCNRASLGIFYNFPLDKNTADLIENQFSNKPGHMSPHQPAVLHTLVRMFNCKNIIEIGSLYGKSTCIMLDALPEAHITCIDTFEYTLDEKGTEQCYYDKFLENTKEYSNRITVKKELSSKVHKELPDSVYDCLFIDGDHSYNGIYTDILHYHTKLAPGGLIVGHDYPNPKAERYNFNGLLHCVNGLIRDKPESFSHFGYYLGFWAAVYTGTPIL